MKAFFIILFVVAMLGFKTNSAKAQVLAQDSMAIVNLYDSCNGPNWILVVGYFGVPVGNYWLKATPLSEWPGITVTGNRVTALKLCTVGTISGDSNIFARIKGTLPYTLGNLTALDTLCINSLSDSLGSFIPPTLGNLTNLTYLNLGNVMSSLDSIPAFIGNLTKLQTLDLSSDSIAGSIPQSFGNLKDLVILNLSGNKLTGSIPDTLTNLNKLEYLLLNNNALNGSIPGGIGNLSSLKQLELHYNSLSGSIPDGVGELGSLTDLLLNDNQLTGPIPASISNLTALKTVDLGDNIFTNNTPIPDLHNSTGITSFGFNNIKVNDTISAWIPALQHLRELKMANDFLQGHLPVSFANGDSLIQLNLADNQLSGPLPASYPTYTDLANLLLNHNQLSGILPDNWSVTHVSWGYVRLDSNQFSGPIPFTFGLAYTIESPYPPTMNDNHFTSVPTSFKNLPFFYAFDNELTFDSLEEVVGTTVSIVAPQASLPLHLNSNVLSVYAGGTLANDTFHWYKNSVLYQTIAGDSTLTITESGNYSVQVTNSIITPATAYGGPGTGFTLYSDTVTFSSLPLMLLSFTGQQENNAVLLKWQTTNEVNTSSFEIERSSDANKFSPVGKVNASGNSLAEKNYSFTDASPNEGENYYRLKMIDIDGRFTYSNVIAINFSEANALKVFPNPVANILTLQIPAASGKINISIINASGKKLMQKIMEGNGATILTTMDTRKLAAGLYYVRITNNGNTQTKSFAKQ